jgi:hypothetical protein
MYRLEQIPDGMVKPLITFALGGVFKELARDPKGILSDPSGTQS